MSINQSYDGPVFAIYQKDEYVALFGKTETVDYYGTSCIKGVLLPVRKDDWTAGLTCYVPIATITKVFEYDSFDHFKKVMADHYKKKAEV
jgi:hypothetical protein